MENFTALRQYIIDNLSTIAPDIDFDATSKCGSATFPAVYLVEKPEEHELTSGNSIIIKFNEISGGSPVRHYSVTVKATSKSIVDLYTVRDGLVSKLDFFYHDCPIANMAKFQLSNEGGVFYDANLQAYSDSLYFDCIAFES